MTDYNTKDLLYQLYNVAVEAAMRVATWITSQTGVFEGHPEYNLILLAIVGAVYLRLS